MSARTSSYQTDAQEYFVEKERNKKFIVQRVTTMMAFFSILNLNLATLLLLRVKNTTTFAYKCLKQSHVNQQKNGKNS